MCALLRRTRRSQRGFGMVEFAVVLPFVLVIIFGMVDFSRSIQANSSIAEAARQGARQASANAASADNPFNTYAAGACSGTVFTQNASGAGCLTDQAILATVKSALHDLTSTVTLANTIANGNAGYTAATCPTPAAGTAELCISPTESNTAGTYVDCTTAKTVLGHDPSPGDLGARKQEWTTPQYRTGRCFLIEVTVKYVFQPWTPFINKIIGSSITMTASTSMVAEY
jgi:Flp pilus assembly protein TadG